MGVAIPARAIEAMSKSPDARKAIFDWMGKDLEGVHLPNDYVLLGTYIRPEKTAGGIYRPQTNVDEDVWQGKVGLLLKLGPDAFKDTDDYTFNFGPGGEPKVGDWVVFKVGDAMSLNVKDFPCRYIRDIGIKMKVNDPAIIF